jgi:ClpX C4-type zinc finger
MIAFRIRINGKDVTAPDDVTVFTMVAEERGERECRVALHAADADMRLHVLAAQLRAGDEVTIAVVDADDLPSRGPRGCTFCGREPHELSSLVAGSGAAICDHCVHAFSASLTSGADWPDGVAVSGESERACGFCEKEAAETSGLVVMSSAAICPECLRSCADLLRESGGR